MSASTRRFNFFSVEPHFQFGQVGSVEGQREGVVVFTEFDGVLSVVQWHFRSVLSVEVEEAVGQLFAVYKHRSRFVALGCRSLNADVHSVFQRYFVHAVDVVRILFAVQSQHFNLASVLCPHLNHAVRFGQFDGVHAVL